MNTRERRRALLAALEQDKRVVVAELAERFADVGCWIRLLPGSDNVLVIRAVERVHEVVDHLVDDMHGAAVHIEQDVRAVLLEFMDSFFHFLENLLTCTEVSRFSYDMKKPSLRLEGRPVSCDYFSQT